MLPSQHRLRSSADFSAVLSRGRRSAGPTVVVHLLNAERARSVVQPHGESSAATYSMVTADRPPRVGLVVGKSVGNSVVRHRTSRRLRALLADRVGILPLGSDMVVRALPPVRAADSARLGRELDRAITRLTAR